MRTATRSPVYLFFNHARNMGSPFTPAKSIFLECEDTRIGMHKCIWWTDTRVGIHFILLSFKRWFSRAVLATMTISNSLKILSFISSCWQIDRDTLLVHLNIFPAWKLLRWTYSLRTCEIVDGKQVYEKEEGKGGWSSFQSLLKRCNVVPWIMWKIYDFLEPLSWILITLKYFLRF